MARSDWGKIFLGDGNAFGLKTTFVPADEVENLKEEKCLHTI